MTTPELLEVVSKLVFRLTGGRPMAREGFAFTDAVSGKPVEYRCDKFGRRWLVDGGAWSLFRVQAARQSKGTE